MGTHTNQRYSVFIIFLLLTLPSHAENAKINLFPKIYLVEPDKKFIDLGPVLIPDKTVNIENLLYVNARKLKADGYIQESREFKKVYIINLEKNARWRGKNIKLSKAVDMAVVGLLIATAGRRWARSTYRVKAGTYYRAIKFIDKIPKSVVIKSTLLDNEQAQFFEASSNIEEQFAAAHALFGTGSIGKDQYIQIRDELISYL